MSEDWRHAAKCRDEDPELFFPVGNSGPALVQEDEAKKMCFDCPVRPECLSWALNTGQEFGVAGGASEKERRDILRRPNASPARKSRQGRKTELSHIDIELILGRLDEGGHLAEVGDEIGVGKEVCRRVWQEHRATKNPPGRNGTKPKAVSAR